MPSKLPPLPSLSSPSISWRHSPSADRSGEPIRIAGAARRAAPPGGRSGEPSWINWSAIIAAVSVSLALVVCILAWIVTHPNKPAVAAESRSMAAIAPQLAPPDYPPAPPLSPAPLLVPVIETIPALHCPKSREDLGDALALVKEPPPLPPPLAPPQPRREPQPAAAPAAPPQPAGETYGTQVLFLNNQATAADQAGRDHKLLFVMHISGNFEDACFT